MPVRNSQLKLDDEADSPSEPSVRCASPDIAQKQFLHIMMEFAEGGDLQQMIMKQKERRVYISE